MQERKKYQLLRPEQKVVGAHPSTSLHSLSGAAGSLCPCLGTASRAELIFFPLYTTNIVLEERLLLQHLFGDWTPAANNIFLSIIAVQKKKKKKKAPEGNLKKCSEKPGKAGSGNGWLDTVGLLQAALVQWDLLGCRFAGLGDTLQDDI